MAKFKEVQCSFCGRMIRDSDKFCIFCGSKVGQTPQKPSISKEERDEIDKELGTGMIQGLDKNDGDSNHENAPFLVTEGSQDQLDDRILSADEIDEKKKTKKKDKEEVSSTVDLPEEIRDQLKTKMKLAIVENKKKLLKKKLKNLTDGLDSERYEYDIEYAQGMNAKLNAFKSVKEELKQEEDDLRDELGPSGQFRVDELDSEMDVLRGQLVELKRSFKHHKIKRDIYEQLKMEYSTAFRKYEDEVQGLRVNIIRWLSQEKTEKNKLEGRIRLLQARFKTHEIDQDDFDSQKSDLSKEIEQITQKIKILELYSRPKRSKWF
ncbi:zinc-ribbon domain-containing protein [Candidatus Lokiarchaeum ossiferum]|uniref:zinc-ribbon domain-containing protein n=1 Tax=Candidatus Lokiarchaeum ossiferum TaxID=2951803 RepID=UPI00352D8D90